MNPVKDYLYAAILCLGKAYPFVTSSIKMKWRYVFLHFLLVFCLLFIPIFSLVIRTQPDQLYSRLFSQDFTNPNFEYHHSEPFNADKINKITPVIYFFNDFVVYADDNIILSAPAEFFDVNESSFAEIFGMLAVYNLYIPTFLLPLLLYACLILLVLQLFFYFLAAVFLGIFRMTSSSFDFGEKTKIAVMSSLPPALLGAAFGFFLPAVHIFLFQMVNLLLLFYLSRKFDKKEKELLLANN
ncbi:MAG: hypothetical protein FWG91_06945 [Lachnospiraceae bacterium]|nr:hypothetical protein [Lachnospiraceae bacterium]